jgi:hypothetical protein
MKLQLIETQDYILAVSDKEIKEGLYLDDTNTIRTCVVSDNQYWAKREHYKKIIAYKPKSNAAKLDLPLLPEVVGDEAEMLAEKHVDNVWGGYKNDRFQHEDIGTDLTLSEISKHDFIAGYKASTKVYTEDDLHKILSDFYVFATEGEVCDHIIINQFIQIHKQPKSPKLFVAEVKQRFQSDKDKRVNPENGVYYELKTTTINGKTYLVGKYYND